MIEACEGICIGGPYDGKRHSYHAPQFYVAVQNQVPAYMQAPVDSEVAAKEVKEVEFEKFGYVFYNSPFSQRRWGFWIPIEIAEDRPYAGVMYESPMDYILTKLSANYRPVVV